MPVVSNTSPLFNLAMIGQVDLLRDQFGEVWIPRAVQQEMDPVKALPELQSFYQAVEDGWIHVSAVRNSQAVRALRLELDHGESEAIVLAQEMGLDRVLIDEREARRVAKSMGIEPTGVLGVLLRAHRKGRINSMSEAMDELRTKAGFYISELLYRRILDLAQ